MHGVIAVYKEIALDFMLWLMIFLIILIIVIAAIKEFVSNLRKGVLKRKGTLKWYGILLIIVPLILFFMNYKYEQRKLEQLEFTQKVISKEEIKQEKIKQEKLETIQKQKALEDIRKFVFNWLVNWERGDMKNYRSCYASDFQSKGMNLDAWVSYKANVYKKRKYIIITIDNLKISENENNATAVFTQYYSSSIFKDSGKKTLELRKINNEWKIYKEIM